MNSQPPNFNAEHNQPSVFKAVEQYINNEGYTIATQDGDRPWGGFFVLAENDADKFITQYFPGFTKEQLLIGTKLSPKFLVVAPNKRLSWQYHFRRAEIWQVLSGPIKVATSLTDEEQEAKTYQNGDIIVLQKGERHRLIGAANNFGIVTEVWQHTDVDAPSDEDDIVRLQDDFGRSSL